MDILTVFLIILGTLLFGGAFAAFLYAFGLLPGWVSRYMKDGDNTDEQIEILEEEYEMAEYTTKITLGTADEGEIHYEDFVLTTSDPVNTGTIKNLVEIHKKDNEGNGYDSEQVMDYIAKNTNGSWAFYHFGPAVVAEI